MADLRTAWSQAGEQLSGLGSKLKQHYAQQRDPDVDTPEARQQAKAQADVKEAVKRLGDAVQDAVDAMSTAARDQAVKDDVKQVGRSVRGALGVTFAEISDELGKAFARSGRGSTADPAPGAPTGSWGGPTATSGDAATSEPGGTPAGEPPGAATGGVTGVEADPGTGGGGASPTAPGDRPGEGSPS